MARGSTRRKTDHMHQPALIEPLAGVHGQQLTKETRRRRLALRPPPPPPHNHNRAHRIGAGWV